MRVCPNCKEKYDDNMEYCMKCGTKLESDTGNHLSTASSGKPFDRQKMFGIGAVVIIFLIVLGIAVSDQNRFKSNQDSIDNYRQQKAYEEALSKPLITDLQINPDWKHYTEGSYIYIEGTVKNISSSKHIRYYEIGVKFLDRNGNVIDTDYTNGSDLDPYDSQEFSIMHKKNSSIAKISLYIKEVN